MSEEEKVRYETVKAIYWSFEDVYSQATGEMPIEEVRAFLNSRWVHMEQILEQYREWKRKNDCLAK